MANFEAFHWNFSLSTNPEIGRSDMVIKKNVGGILRTYYTTVQLDVIKEPLPWACGLMIQDMLDKKM